MRLSSCTLPKYNKDGKLIREYNAKGENKLCISQCSECDLIDSSLSRDIKIHAFVNKLLTEYHLVVSSS